jgi:hypothetical protein
MKDRIGKLDSLCNDFTSLTEEKQDALLTVSKRLLYLQRAQINMIAAHEKDADFFFFKPRMGRNENEVI